MRFRCAIINPSQFCSLLTLYSSPQMRRDCPFMKMGSAYILLCDPRSGRGSAEPCWRWRAGAGVLALAAETLRCSTRAEIVRKVRRARLHEVAAIVLQGCLLRVLGGGVRRGLLGGGRQHALDAI